MIDKQKDWIDTASYEELLRKWRFASLNDQMFSGDTGIYYQKKMKERREIISDKEHTRISKFIGWDK